MSDKDSNNEKYILSSVSNALSILNLFYTNKELSVADAASYLHLNRSSVFRFFVTLESMGFLAKGKNNKYCLGIRIFSLGQVAHSRLDIVKHIHPYLVQLSECTGETANLVTWEGSTNVVYIDKSLSNAQLKMDTVLGSRRYAHMTAGGRTLLAFKSDSFISDYIKAVDFLPQTPNSITDVKRLLKEIDNIRLNGYAFENEESEMGLACFAVPLGNASGQVYAAISTSGPSTRMIRNKEHILAEMNEKAAVINSLS